MSMQILNVRLGIVWLLGTCVGCSLHSAEPITIESLLKEMVDRDNVARYPMVDFRLKQASSYDRNSKTPDDPKGWFANFDRSTSDEHHNYVRTEQHNGRKEWVVMEDQGAGVITRIWVPWRNQLKPGSDIVIRFYLDGASEPTLEGNLFNLIQGKGLVPFPLAHESLRSAVSFLPIPYAKSCKVTMSDHPFFFQFTYREYQEEVDVKTFSMEDFRSAKPLIDTICHSLLNPEKQGLGEAANLQLSIGGGQEQSLSLPDGTAAVRSLSLRLGSYEDANVTRHVVLKMSFDGKETVWCPIGDFFGSGIGLNPFQGWYRTVDADGTMTSRWVMPYQNNATISILNLGDTPVDVDLSATVDDWKWDSSSLYFHAGWRGQYPVPTRPYSDWNYVTLAGRGVYVGDTLTVMNPVQRWWGEGDEKIFVDGERFPSIFGTGTEDYYAYSWGGRSTDFYEHPFHAQTFCHKYNKLNRKPKIDEKNTQGFSTETRTRALDTMPFASSLRLDMEVWSWTDCDMGYGVGVYWYGDAVTTANHKPDPAGALAVPPLPKVAPSVQTSSQVRDRARPNFVVIFTDDQGYADLSCFGGEHVSTPRIDQMAAEGSRLTSFYVAAPLCTPSRAALMTGCYPKRIDMAYGSDFAVLLAADKKGLNPEEITIAEVLKSVGYKTGIFGKWHLGDQPAFLPTRQGFDEYFGIPFSHDIHPFHPRQSHFKFPPLPLLDNEKVIELDPDADHLTRRITVRAIKFFDANKDEPFFLYVPHPIPHAPLHVSPPFMADVPESTKAKLKKEKGVDYKTRRELFRPAISEIDWSVGHILDSLKKNEIDQNTVVIFTSDNGPATGKATPLRGRKGSTFEGGMREPTVIRWPGKIPVGGVNDEIMTSMDLLPTFAKLAGAEIPTDRTIDGKDIWPTLIGESGTPHEKFFYYRDNSLNAVRSGKWKLHVEDGEPAELYNLETDIGEKKNVLQANPDVAKRLEEHLRAFAKDIADNSRPAAFVEHPQPLSK